MCPSLFDFAFSLAHMYAQTPQILGHFQQYLDRFFMESELNILSKQPPKNPLYNGAIFDF